MHAPIINMNNVHALFKLNVSAFEALHVDINFKMHKFAVFDLKFQIPTASQSEGTYTVYFVCFRHPQYLIPVETLQHLFVSSNLNKSFISNHD